VFTGLIQAKGRITFLKTGEVKLTWEATSPTRAFDDLAIGDSVSVDGVCLTVVTFLDDGFIAAVSPETLHRSTLGQLTGESCANLEPSLRVGSKLGGHFVTGHVDGIGYLEASVPTANAWEMSFTVPDPHVSRYIVPKGSIAVNGVSLTVAECSSTGDWFKVAVIPLTYAETNLSQLQPGSSVNLEGDVLGKYVEKFLRLGDGFGPEMGAIAYRSNGTREITSDFLVEHGYLG
jgi:riboflavin synthase